MRVGLVRASLRPTTFTRKKRRKPWLKGRGACHRAGSS
jgi:hypothetical protein